MFNIRSRLKISIIGRLLSYVYDVYRFPSMIGFKKKYKNIPKGSFIFLGTPAFKNLGDHLIACAIVEFLKKIFPKDKIFEIPTHVYNRYRSFISNNQPEECVVVIPGGGWMGSLWPKDEYMMQSMIRSFSSCHILVMPQTVYYEDDAPSKKILNDAITTYASCRNLFMTFRERASYDFAVRNFEIEYERIRLFPDIALSLSGFECQNKKNKRILLCMREDIEKSTSINAEKVVSQYAKSKGFTYFVTSTIAKTRIPIWRRTKEIHKKIEEFAKANLVVTDRLHGMIFAILAGTLCVAIDNKTHKVRGVFDEWIEGQYPVFYLDYECTEKDLMDSIETLIGKSDEWKHYNFNQEKTASALKDFEQFVRHIKCSQKK